ncbi:hypothetical protein PZ938_12200 [Luteipulveratus sp. YIM 133132]|uniref:Uncharacterized protein n=1 Tax=Luteipulveratus flavus TaxID=3031728 RepID=A0ABT6CAA3_9MICO|nr:MULTISPECIES: hypothetical protein [unclassified Luteipulveratus]MDE9366364.1 hypothetical protein [Luteipulveratus sp. YIM 133132]MDF8265453.1 hypothetical protein [Luteipulveratus sp. YIM 133296]
MTIKAWRVEKEWQEPFVEALQARGASAQVVGDALGKVDDALTRSGSTATAQFGDPRSYAATVDISGSVDQRVSRIRAILLAVAGLIGLFLALWGFTGMVREGVDTIAGMPPVLPFVVGLVIVVAAAVADTVLGRHADIFATPAGQTEAPGMLALVLNRLAPWIIVALTLIGMLLIWIKES